MPFIKSSWLRRDSWHVAVTLVLLFSVHLLYSGLGNYTDSYDSGVYLESARMLGRGFAPYRQIFCSQPPLWLPLIQASFRLFGESFLAGQLLTATAGLITIVAVILITEQLGGKGGAILAATLVILSPLQLEWSRTINADVPSVALAAVGMALAAGYARNGSRRWLAAAAVAVAGSILLKLSGLYAVPSLFLFAIARSTHAHDKTRRQQLGLIARDSLIVSGVFAAITLLCLALFRSDRVWDQVVTFHWVAQRAYPAGSLYDKCHTLAQLLIGERLLIMFAPLAGLCLFSGLDGLALFAWPCFTSLGLLDHRPLFDHHIVALIPAVAVASGVGAGYLRFVYTWFARWLSAQTRPLQVIGGSVCVGVTLAIMGVGVRQAWIAAADQQEFIRVSALPSPDLRIVELIGQHTRPSDMVVTDAQGIAFFAARDVPPDLTDTSYARITTGYLQPREVIDQAERYNVRLMLLWTYRLSLMPEVVRWAEKRFPHRVDLDRGRVLYTME